MKVFFFWKPNENNGWMSNWSIHPIEENGIRFRTAEHYIMYHKALLMNDIENAELILEVSSPKQVRAIGRKVKNYDNVKWEAARYDIACRALTLKINQHADLKEALLETNGSFIGEASPYDAVWGIGCSETELIPDNWPGLNILGKAWMQVREILNVS